MDLSTQMVADCSRRHPGHVGRGCGGGNAIDTWELANKSGVPTEWQYPYDSGHGTEYDCRFIPEPVNKTEFWNATPPVVKIKGSAQVGPNDLFATMHAVATKGPLAISVDADNYHSCTFFFCSSLVSYINIIIHCFGFLAFVLTFVFSCSSFFPFLFFLTFITH